MQCVRCGLNGLKTIYFSNFGSFLPSSNWFFPVVLGKVLNYWASFSLFLASFYNQRLLALLNYYFFVEKTRVIKLLIIYLILKNKYINIFRGCGFLIIKPQIVLYHVIRCGYAILLKVLVWFLWFGEHLFYVYLVPSLDDHLDTLCP